MRYQYRQVGWVLTLILAGSAQAQVQGNTKFGTVPAIAYDNKAASVDVGRPGAAASGAGASNHQPGYNRAIMAPVTPDESEKAIWSRVPERVNQGVAPIASSKQRELPQRKPSAARVSGDTGATAPTSIAELARALRGNPDLIYEYVRNNIELVPNWGIMKGEYGAMLDNQGTAFDQAALMVALLRQSGFTASVVKGRINLTAVQLRDWMGLDTSNVCAVLNLLGNAQIPTSGVVATAAGSCPGSTAALSSLRMDHVWVKVNIGGTNYFFDPSYKPHNQKTGINLVGATGYNAAAYMSAATSGATITADYVQGVNRNAVRSSLTTYASKLATFLRTNLPSGTLDDVIGGLAIIPHNGVALRQTALPYQDSTVALTEWTTDVPANYKPTLRVQYQGIDRTFTSDAIYGRRLTITYNASNQPLLSLDGVLLATGNPAVGGSYGNVALVVTHGAYAQTVANQSFTQQIKVGGTFVIGNGWGPAGRGTVDLHRTRLDEAIASGAAAASEAVLGSTLAVLSSSWISQVNHSGYITDRLAKTNTLYHHQVGIAGYTTAAYVDLPGNMLSVVSQQASKDKEAAVFFSSAMHSSIFESTTVQQTTGGSAVSTVKLIDLAVAANHRIYDATSANYASAVKPNLVGCANWTAGFQSAVAAGRRLILPAQCTLTEGSWTGAAYYSVLVGAGGYSLGAIIGGGLAGGFSSSNMSPNSTANNTLTNSVSPSTLTPYSGKAYGDPVDMAKGNFLHEHEDFSVGTGAFPLGLSFVTSYTSSARTEAGPLGYGWNHNLAASVAVSSDGLQGMGEDSALDAVGAIAEQLVSLDLMSDNAKPVTKMVLATLGQRWFGEQVTNNTAIVKQGVNGEVFAKLPDGTYNAPPGNPNKLSLEASGSYSYETVNRAKLAFNAAGKIDTYTHPTGIQAKFTYAGGALTQVSNSLGRVLTLAYLSGRIDSVGDGSRSIKYIYDASGNLINYRNTLGQTTVFQYDQRGRIGKVFYPSNPTVAYASNVYDTLGRVQSQTNADGQLYTYYFAGSRSEEVGPLNQSLVSYLDANGKVVKSIDPLGRATVNTYDGQTRLVKSVRPEGNSLEYQYDDASCATQLRCTHNISRAIQRAKPGSGLTDIVVSNTYEASFNKIASTTDALLQTTNFTYTAQGNPLAQTGPADVTGVQPLTTYGYTAYSVAGFPAFYLQTSVTQKISATGSVTNTTTYDASNKFVPLTQVIDAGTGTLNLTTTYTHDTVGNVTAIDGPRTDVIDKAFMTYDAQRQLVQITEPSGKLIKTAYDADGRVIRSAAQLGTTWLINCNTYSASGMLQRAWGPAQTSADTVCPAAAAPVSVVDYGYDSLNRKVRVTENLTVAEGGNRITDTIYNLDNSVQRVNRGVGSTAAVTHAVYTYTPNGRLLTVADGRNNLTTYVYDGHDRKVKVRFPAPATANTSSTTDVEQYAYNANGSIVSTIKRDGVTIATTYDKLNRPIGRTYPNAAENVNFAYDLLSRETRAWLADGSFDVSSTYDNAGRIVSTTAGGRTISYRYDAAGNRVRTTWPEVTPFYVTTIYDVMNRPVAVKELDSATLVTYSYDDRSRLVLQAFGNGTSTSYTYSTQSALSTLRHDLTGTSHDNTLSYGRNQVQDITRLEWNNDLYQWAGYKNGTVSYVANGLNAYTNVGSIALTHDLNGNLRSDGVWTYRYDSDNRLTSASKSGVTAALTYDALGRLRRTVIGTDVVNLLYSGSQLIAEYDDAGVVKRRYVRGSGDAVLVSYDGAGTTVKQWLYSDHLGSVVASADATGTATAIHRYGPFGEPDDGAGVRLRYTGQQLIAPLGLYYYKARFYSPALGRFLQTDPIGYAADLNLYAYVDNNPVNGIDASGLGPEAILKIAQRLGVDKLIARRGWRISEKTAVEQAATKGPNGGIICPGCKKEVDKFDIHHVTKWAETQRELLARIEKGETITRKEVLDRYGVDIEAMCPACNRSDNKLTAAAVAAITASVSGNANAAGKRGIFGTDVTWRDVGEFLVDFLVPGGVSGVGEGSDIVPGVNAPPAKK